MKTPENHMNIVELLLQCVTDEQVDGTTVSQLMQQIEDMSDDADYGEHIMPQMFQLYGLIAYWQDYDK